MLQLHPLINQLNQAKNQALNNQPKVTNYMRNTGSFINEGDAPTKSTQPTTPPVTPNVQPPVNQPTAPPITLPPVTQAPPAFDQNAFLKNMQDGINGMYDAQQQSRLAALKASRDKATGQINLQDAQLAPQYAGMRNQADVVSNQNVQRLRELMDSMGLHGSGENVSATVGLQSARQGALNDLNTQEQQQHNDFAQRIADLNDPAQEQAVISELQAQRAQALLDATNRANDVGYQRQRDSIGDQRYNSETAYSHGRDAVGDQRYNSETDYSHGRDAIGDQRYNNETAYSHGRDAIGDQRYNSETTYNHGQDSVKNAQWESEQKYNRGQDALNRTDRNAQQAVDNAWKQKEWSQMSPAEQQKAALDLKNSQALVNSRAAVKTKSNAAKAKVNAGKPAKQKSTTASYNDGLSYWTGKLDDVRKQGAYRVEQALRNDPAQIKAMTAQGYDVNSVIDALYSAASNGQFKSKADYQKYVTALNKQTANNSY